jgi:hypothetical protein
LLLPKESFLLPKESFLFAFRRRVYLFSITFDPNYSVKVFPGVITSQYVRI